MKVLILGAGPAGCSIAYALKKKGVSDITVVENDLVGGCCYTKKYEGIPFEFGPQIMYTDEDRLRKVFEEYLTQHAPKTHDNEFHPALLVDGTIENVHDFPVTIGNVLKHENPVDVIDELYRLNLDQPDFSNFENYVTSRIGPSLYEKYVKNYNLKQWKIHPKDMDAEWAKFRTLTLRKTPDMFRGKWQGHPGDYNPMWKGMLKDVKQIKGTASVSDDFKSVKIDGQDVTEDYDLIVSTLPLHSSLDYINTYKVFVAIKADKTIMPSYANSFPNNFSFVRIIEYRQQFFVDSDFTVLSFAFPWKDEKEEQKYHDEVKAYCKSYLKKDIYEMWIWQKEKLYPVSNKDTRQKVSGLLEQLSNTKIVPLGRSGVHAYISKDTCIRMALNVADQLDDVLAKGPSKMKVLSKLREKLS